MSVAFRRESDDEHLEPKFELPIAPGPNFVTPAGLTQIETRVAELEAAVEAAVDDETRTKLRRELRYWHARQATAQIAPPPNEGEVGIGSRVRFKLRGAEQSMTVTGHDEADPGSGKVAFSAPLARSLMGLAAGEVADFAGDEDAIEVIEVSAP